MAAAVKIRFRIWRHTDGTHRLEDLGAFVPLDVTSSVDRGLAVDGM